MIEIKEHPLLKIRWGIIPIVNYNGVLVTKTKEGYSINKNNFKTTEEVDSFLEKTYKAIEKSIIS